MELIHSLQTACIELFLESPQFASVDNLRAVFTTPELKPHANRIPDLSGNRENRVIHTIAFLLDDAKDRDGRSALPHFIHQLGQLNKDHPYLAPRYEDLLRQITDYFASLITTRRLRVFISSPGDVGAERQEALAIIKELCYDPDFLGKVYLEPVSWDKPGDETPLIASRTPQDSINQKLKRPSECDVVIAIFWSRMGTPLPAEFEKPDGGRYQSGTEWEYLDAMAAATQSQRTIHRPQIIVYRRKDDPQLNPIDPQFESKRIQWERVQTFFENFTDANGAIINGYNSYSSPTSFAEKFRQHLRKLTQEFMAYDPPDEEERIGLPLWSGSPFPGLRAFTPADASIFYGRNKEVDEVLVRLEGSNFVAVIGASGSGKSSMVAAGVIPRLIFNSIEGSKDWILPQVEYDAGELHWKGLRITPGSDPFTALTQQLGPLIQEPAEDIAKRLKATPDRIHDIIGQLLQKKPAWARVLIFIDQFEEIFDDKTPAAVTAKFTELLAAVVSKDRAKIIITMRSDFFSKLGQFPTLNELINAGSFSLSEAGYHSKYTAITHPAHRAGLRFEAGLQDTILEAIGTQIGTLPLLAYALDELYHTRDQVKGVLTRASYDAMGGVTGSITQRADAVYDNLSRQAQGIFPRITRLLADVNEEGNITRRILYLDTLQEQLDPQTFQHASELVNAFVDARLFVRQHDEKKRKTVQVAHEAVLNKWTRVANLIEHDKRFLLWRRRTFRDVGQWEQNNRHPSYLHSGLRFMESREQVKTFPDDIPDEFQPFVQASLQRHRRQQMIRWSALALMLVISTIAIANFIITQWRIQAASSTTAHYANAQLNGYTDVPLLIPPFYLEQHEVSVAEYQLCMDAGVCTAPSANTLVGNVMETNDSQLPINMVTAYQAHQFCSWIGKRLPTNAEWEYAAQGADQRNVPWSDNAQLSPDHANVNFIQAGTEHDPQSAAIVNDKTYTHGATDEGVMHLLGNVAEWVGTPIDIDETTGQATTLTTYEDTVYTVSDCSSGCLEQWDGITPQQLPVRGRSWSNWDIAPDELSIVLSRVVPSQPNLAQEYIGFRCAQSAN